MLFPGSEDNQTSLFQMFYLIVAGLFIVWMKTSLTYLQAYVDLTQHVQTSRSVTPRQSPSCSRKDNMTVTQRQPSCCWTLVDSNKKLTENSSFLFKTLNHWKQFKRKFYIYERDNCFQYWPWLRNLGYKLVLELLTFPLKSREFSFKKHLSDLVYT